jgi:hypothetical protein
LLAFDLLSGECFFAAGKVAKSEQIAAYFAERIRTGGFGLLV